MSQPPVITEVPVKPTRGKRLIRKTLNPGNVAWNIVLSLVLFRVFHQHGYAYLLYLLGVFLGDVIWFFIKELYDWAGR